jgi:hypothetical protein
LIRRREDLLEEGVVRPVVGKEGTLGGIIVAIVVIAGRGIWRGLDQGSSGEEVEDLPCQVRGPQQVARVRLAAIAEATLGQGGVVEAEKGNVGQLQVREIGEDVVSQLKSLVGEVLDGSITGGGIDLSHSRGNSLVGGLYCES